jgi:uncharacterized membrane protein YraQ (UPF0718 family)
MKQKQPNPKKPISQLVLIVCYFIFLGISFLFGFEPGKQIGTNFSTFVQNMLGILPCTFLLVSLFDVWVKREVVERHFGEGSGIKGYIWAILLAGTVTGGLYVAFPVVYSLYKKGARFSTLFTYLGASAICRVPMATFEASFLGIKFTAIRFLVSLPLVVVSSIVLEKYLVKLNFQIKEGP